MRLSVRTSSENLLVLIVTLSWWHCPCSAARALQADGNTASPCTLKFDTCNGYGNQRLSLVYGLLLAHATGRAAVAPDFLLDGTQTARNNMRPDTANVLPFQEAYDLPRLQQALTRLEVVGLMSANEAPPAASYTQLSLAQHTDAVMALDSHSCTGTPHLQIDCPLFKLLPTTIEAKKDVLWAVLDALQPVPRLQQYVDEAIEQLMHQSKSGIYQVLHLRMEEDWVEHCANWATIDDGVVRDNCFNNSAVVHQELLNRGWDTIGTPLYVATEWEAIKPAIAQQALISLFGAGFSVVKQSDLYTADLSREEKALVDYYIALNAERFMGNSVSSFSALLLLERQHLGRWAAYYNEGNVPLNAMVPLYKLPWVFTYNSWSQQYDYMVMAAVRTAQAVGGLEPYCLFIGDKTATIYNWFIRQQVTVIRHNPAWRHLLIAKLDLKNNEVHSHLFKSAKMQLGTWQRIDIPVLPQLSQYEYVLFSDADVFFRRPMSLDSFSLPLPKVVGMAKEVKEIDPWFNAGVMLMHLPEMRRTYQHFVNFTFNNEHGMFYPDYGPGDQGAYNQFYEDQITWMPMQFNAKHYLAYDPEAFVVHFHGPKPTDIAEFATQHTCAFAEMCQQAMLAGFCDYFKDWAPFTSAKVARPLLRICGASSQGQSSLDGPV